MVPMDNIEEIGLREVIDADGVTKVISILKDKETDMSNNWSRRYRTNMDKIRSGSIYEVAEVVRNLSIRERDKGLSTGERKMLDNARQILVSELVLAQEAQEDHVILMLDKLFA